MPPTLAKGADEEKGTETQRSACDSFAIGWMPPTPLLRLRGAWGDGHPAGDGWASYSADSVSFTISTVGSAPA